MLVLSQGFYKRIGNYAYSHKKWGYMLRGTPEAFLESTESSEKTMLKRTRYLVENIQMSQSRESVIEKLKISDGVQDSEELEFLEEKVQWIKDWINDPSTDMVHIQKFIALGTGKMSIGKNDITFALNKETKARELLYGATCFSMIDVNYEAEFWSHNAHLAEKDAFLGALMLLLDPPINHIED